MRAAICGNLHVEHASSRRRLYTPCSLFPHEMAFRDARLRTRRYFPEILPNRLIGVVPRRFCCAIFMKNSVVELHRNCSDGTKYCIYCYRFMKFMKAVITRDKRSLSAVSCVAPLIENHRGTGVRSSLSNKASDSFSRGCHITTCHRG